MAKPRLPSEILHYFKTQGAKGGKTSSARMTKAARRARAVAAGKASAAARAKTKTTRDRASGRYTDTRLEKLCVCRHTLGQHTADRRGDQQECLIPGCLCVGFRKRARS